MVMGQNRMMEYVAERLEASAQYNVLASDTSHLLVEQLDPSAQVYVALHTKRVRDGEVRRLHDENMRAGMHTAHVFYKDSTTFCVRLGGRGRTRQGFSLNHYSFQTRRGMIELSELEQAALDAMPHNSRLLTYYQPHTARLQEGLRIYQMYDLRFAIDTKIAHEIERVNLPQQLSLDGMEEEELSGDLIVSEAAHMWLGKQGQAIMHAYFSSPQTAITEQHSQR